MSEPVRDLETGKIVGESEQSPSSWTEAEWNRRALRTEYSSVDTSNQSRGVDIGAMPTDTEAAVREARKRALHDYQPRSTQLNPYYTSTAGVDNSAIYQPLAKAPRPPLARVRGTYPTVKPPTHPLAVLKALGIIFVLIFAVGYLAEWLR